jgi:DNA-binding transcriptional regulator YiaG
MKDKNDNIFEFDLASFWKEQPGYEHIDYIPVINQDTREFVRTSAEKIKTNSEEQILEEVDKFYYRYKFFRNNLPIKNLQQIAQWLQEKSNLLRLVTAQLAFYLLKLYNHLLKVNLKNGKVPEKELQNLIIIKDKKGNPVKIELNIDDTGFKEIIDYLEKTVFLDFDWSIIWEKCAKDILIYLAVSATERMEKDLGETVFKTMKPDSFKKTFDSYLKRENSAALAERISLLLHESSQEIVQAIIKGLDLSNLTLADLDKILGFSPEPFVKPIPATESRLTDTALAVPTGSALISSINAQIRKDLWDKDSNGIACFQHQAKGNPNNHIEHYITKPGDIEILPWEQAEQIIDKFGFNTVKLHLIFAAHTMNQFVPWEGKFSLKATDVIKYLGWDKRTDVPAHEKLSEIAKTAFVLDCLLVKSVWVEGRNKKGGIDASTPTGRMWSIVVDPRGQLNLEGKVEKPEEVYITVQPGLIFQSFLNKAGSRLKEALYQFGYLAQNLLKIDPYHDELALRLAIHLTMDSRVHTTGKYRVETLLKALLPHTVIDESRSNKRKAYDLKQRWDNALTLLMQLGWQIQFDESYPEWLQPGSNATKPSDKRKMKILDWLLQAKLIINPPKPIPELLAAKVEPKPKTQKLQSARATRLTGDKIRKARASKGWTQRELAGWIGVTQTLVGYWEKGKRTPSGDMEAKLRQLLEIAD